MKGSQAHCRKHTLWVLHKDAPKRGLYQTADSGGLPGRGDLASLRLGSDNYPRQRELRSHTGRAKGRAEQAELNKTCFDWKARCQGAMASLGRQ